jgi:hypothetical protein
MSSLTRTRQPTSAECVKVFAAHDAQLTEERYNQLNAWLAVCPATLPIRKSALDRNTRISRFTLIRPARQRPS